MITEAEIDFIVRDCVQGLINAWDQEMAPVALAATLEGTVRGAVRQALKKAGLALVEIGNGRHR